MYNKQSREQLGRLGVQMEAIVNTAKAEGNRGLTSAERVKFSKLEGAYTALQDDISISERADQITNGARISEYGGCEMSAEEKRDTYRTSPRAQREKTPRAQAFTKVLRDGVGRMDSSERDH